MATPEGRLPLREIFFRADKVDGKLLKTGLPVTQLTPDDGWCDESNDPRYNKFVDLKNFDLKISHEKLYRDDDIYDIILVVGYNDQPAIPGKGSVIFIHIARENYTGTAGCIAFSKEDLIEIITELDKDSNVVIGDDSVLSP